MGPMRQRVLLVAGWVIAAVVTSLVASGAVAVAGGQVFDRPLRPLTAAEVAAVVMISVGAEKFETVSTGSEIVQDEMAEASIIAAESTYRGTDLDSIC